VENIGPLKVDASFALPACRIYGYEDDSEYEEDHHSIDAAMKRGLVFGRWFSVNCLEGEPGTQPVTELREITKEEFDRASRRGWALVN
jgi:hypothetical protein